MCGYTEIALESSPSGKVDPQTTRFENMHEVIKGYIWLAYFRLSKVSSEICVLPWNNLNAVKSKDQTRFNCYLYTLRQ